VLSAIFFVVPSITCRKPLRVFFRERKHQDAKLCCDWCSIYNSKMLIGPSKNIANNGKGMYVSLKQPCGTGSVAWLQPERLPRRLNIVQCVRNWFVTMHKYHEAGSSEQLPASWVVLESSEGRVTWRTLGSAVLTASCTRWSWYPSLLQSMSVPKQDLSSSSKCLLELSLFAASTRSFSTLTWLGWIGFLIAF